MKTGSRPQPIRLDQVAERLQTPEGRALLGKVMDSLEPSLAGAGMLEASDVGPAPKDRFSRAVLDELCSTFSPAHQANMELPGAVLRALERFSAADGSVSAAAVQRALGPAGLQFLGALSKIEDRPARQPMDDRRALDRVGLTKLQAAATRSVEPPKMRALETMAAELAQPGELEGMKFFGLQHLFLSSVSMFDQLHALGIEHEDMRLLGKIYSTNFAAASVLEGRGATVDAASKVLVGGRDFETSMADAIRHNLGQLIEQLPHPPSPNPRPQILLIDDGAEAIKILHEEYPQHAGYFIGVEQTRRGARILHGLDLKCPVVNVAESWAKLEWESPMIGHSVVLETTKKLDRLEAYGINTGQEATVLGYGAVGEAVARSLRARGFEVHVFDPDPERRARAELAGMVAHADKASALPHGQTLVSCVGKRTLFPEDHDLLPDGAILVNAASADDELGPQDLTPFSAKGGVRDADGDMWNYFQGKPVNLGLAEATAHCDWVVRRPSGKELLLVNQGFVVNMTGERDPIPARYIQLTRSLLFLGALAAKRADGPGIVEVPKDWQEKLVGLVREELLESGEALDQPSWEKHDPQAEPERKAPPAGLGWNATPAQRARDRADRALRQRRIAEAVLKNEREAVFKPAAQTSDAGTYGHRFGPTEPLTPEAVTLDRVGLRPPTELTPGIAGISSALEDVGRHFNAELRARLAESGAEGAVGGGFKVATELGPQAEYERVYARYVVDLTRAQLERHGKAGARTDLVARHLAGVLAKSNMPVDVVIAELRKAEDGETRKIAQALYRATS